MSEKEFKMMPPYYNYTGDGNRSADFSLPSNSELDEISKIHDQEHGQSKLLCTPFKNSAKEIKSQIRADVKFMYRYFICFITCRFISNNIKRPRNVYHILGDYIYGAIGINLFVINTLVNSIALIKKDTHT